MVRRSTQPDPNAIAVGYKFLRKTKVVFLEKVMQEAGITYTQFMEKATRLPTGNYLQIESMENEVAVKAMENIISEMQNVLDSMRRQL